jgi:hypothetical protein
MVHEITLEYTEPLLRQAVLAFWRRTVGVGMFVALAIVASGLAWMVWQGDRSWVVGVGGGLLVFGVGIPFAVYFVHLRRSLAKFRAMGSPQAKLTLDEASFEMSSDLGSTSLPWSTVTEVWRYQDFWLLFFSKAQFVTIPLASVPAEAQAYLLSHVSAAGGKVVG